MSKDKGWDEERTRRFAQASKMTGESIYSRIARKITGDWIHSRDNYVFLDVGTGPGHLPIAVKTLFPEVKAIGIDPQDYMIKMARQNAEAAGYADIELMPGSAESIPLDSETVDFAISQWAFLFWEDPEKGLSEIHRVLKPDGKVVITDWNRSFPRWKFYTRNFLMIRRGNWDRAKLARASFKQAYKFETVLRLVLEGNFTPVETEGKELLFFIKAVKTR